MMFRDLNTVECKSILNNQCPNCGSSSWLHGPKGGLCINVECGDCGMRINVMMHNGQLLYAQSLRDPLGYTPKEDKPIELPRSTLWSRIKKYLTDVWNLEHHM